jgi:UDP-N-acetylglucosamine 4,6-dehydratase
MKKFSNYFSNKILLITGGTGSFGNAVLNLFLNSDLAEIRIFSRDEKKQDDMRKFYNNPRIKFYLGDVRDYGSIVNAIRGVDFIFHAAALKQVPSCEFHPIEAVKTNILGTENLLEAAINFKVKRVVCLSTDKAVYPISAMGTTKAVMEKIALAKSRSSTETIISLTRYGNVLASRGSVIPLFINKILAGEPICITDPKMTRFVMTLDEAVKLVLFSFENAIPGEIYVQKSPSVSIEVLARALTEIFGKSNYPIDIMGTRHGEKLHEVLLSREEVAIAKSLGDYFCIPPDLRDLNYSKFVEVGEIKISEASEYNSNNARKLNHDEILKILLKLDIIQLALKNGFLEDRSDYGN